MSKPTRRGSQPTSVQTDTQQKRINGWINKLEQKAKALLDSFEIEELNAKDRAELALKMFNQIGRFMMLSQQLETSTNDGGLQVLLGALMSKMRGEPEMMEDERL